MRTLEDLLCIIHRDGGHYIAEYGIEKAYDDALMKHYEQRSSLEREKVLIHRLKYAEKIMVEMENEMINNWNHASMIFAEYVNKYDPIKEE